MALSNMGFEKQTVAEGVQILKRKPFEAIAMTLDFSDVSAGPDGRKVMKAGTPIGAAGVEDNTATVVGILLHDVDSARPQGAVLKKAYIDKTVAEKHWGKSYETTAVSALPMIIFE